MNQVWLVTIDPPYEPGEIDSIWSTEDKANQRRNELLDGDSDLYNLSPYHVFSMNLDEIPR